MAMYMKEPEKDIVITHTPVLKFALLLMVIGVIALGVYPGPFIDAAKASIAPFIEPAKLAMTLM